MNTIADFKRRLIPGTKVKTTNHSKLVGYTPAPDIKPIYGDFDFGVREVAEVNTVGFSFWSMKDGKRTQSHCSWPKRADITFDGDNKAVIRWEGTSEKVLTYEFV